MIYGHLHVWPLPDTDVNAVTVFLISSPSFTLSPFSSSFLWFIFLLPSHCSMALYSNLSFFLLSLAQTWQGQGSGSAPQSQCSNCIPHSHQAGALLGFIASKCSLALTLFSINFLKTRVVKGDNGKDECLMRPKRCFATCHRLPLLWTVENAVKEVEKRTSTAYVLSRLIIVPIFCCPLCVFY